MDYKLSQQSHTAVMVRELDAGDIGIVIHPYGLWDKGESEVLGVKPRCLVPAAWRKELPSMNQKAGSGGLGVKVEKSDQS